MIYNGEVPNIMLTKKIRQKDRGTGNVYLKCEQEYNILYYNPESHSLNFIFRKGYLKRKNSSISI